jgi:apolipoprotein N-acyltransferase
LPFLVFAYFGIFPALHRYTSIPFVLSAILLLLLSTYHALYFLMFSFAYRKLNIFLAPFAWVFFEFLKNNFAGGLPIMDASKLVHLLPFVQWASIFGSYFLSFCVILINVLFFCFLTKKKTNYLLLACFLVLFLFVGGKLMLNTEKGEINVCIVQGDIPQDEKWQEIFFERNINIHLNLIKNIKDAEIIICSETVYPYLFTGYFPYFIKKPLIFGAITKKNGNIYNSAIEIFPQKNFLLYDKRRLVPFGEFIPFHSFANHIPIIKNFTKDIKDYSRGKDFIPFVINSYKLGILICYELEFENLLKKWMKKNVNGIVVMSNDAWYKGSALPYILYRTSIVKAVENRTWIIRCANTGISCIVDPYGRVVTKIGWGKRDISCYYSLSKSRKSVYLKGGYLFVYLSTLFFIVLSLFFILNKHVDRKT